MGWASGASLAEEVWQAVKDEIRPEELQERARKIISLFKDHDADDWDPNMEIVCDAAEPEDPEDPDEEEEEEDLE